MKLQKKITEKHYYSVFFFLFIMVYSCIIPGQLKFWSVDDLTLSYHAVDYSMGFCSRFLPGAIFKLFCGDITETKANIYLTVLMIAFFVVLSIFLEKFMLSVGSQCRFSALIILLFFLTGPATFSIFIKVLGMLDVYWVFAAALLFIFLSKKGTYILLFIPFLICVLTYHVTWLCYIPFFAIIILYKISIASDKKEKVYLWCMVIFSLIISLGLALYWVTHERDNLTYTIEEFIDIFQSKGIDPTYYNSSLYYYFPIEMSPEVLSTDSILDELLLRISINFEIVNLPAKIPLFLLITPVVVFIYKFFFSQIKNCDNMMKKLSYSCMIILFAGTICSSLFLTTDLIRWTGHAFLPLFANFLYVLYNEGDTAWISVKESLNKYSFKSIAVYLILYASIVYNPYFV